MSRALFLAPHNDDETLFGAFTLLRHRPDVLVCLRSYVQGEHGVTAYERERETAAAMAVLGCEWTQMRFTDDEPDWPAVKAAIEANFGHHSLGIEAVFAPAFEPGGNAQHNAIAEIAADLFGAPRFSRERPGLLRRYLTYTGSPAVKSRGVEVVPEPEWIALKLQALACYRSQHLIGSGSRAHFMEDLREYAPTRGEP